SVISSSVSRSADPLITHRAVLIAQAYADEILGKRFSESTPVGGVPPATDASVCTVGAEGGESRPTYDDLDDYDGLSDSPPALQSDTDFSRYDGYTVSVSVTCAGTALGFANNHDAKSVSITITSPDNRTAVFSLYRGNF
ncbi:MAG: type II secretion system protein, partial [Pseudomonadota bacterium]